MTKGEAAGVASPALEELQALSDAATPGPWMLNSCEGTNGGDECWQQSGHQDIFVPDGMHRYGTQAVDIQGGEDQDRWNAEYIVALVNWHRSTLEPKP